ncbi:HNH endonuclease [Vibrio agarivorans]|uniref:HNH endonuclease n=1 Tax=Vibrio agarivorans TaxID=153622 RepID=UPI002230B9DD|nr:HNH endonuclease signature motif containing protein [Vibrio agarivorans]
MDKAVLFYGVFDETLREIYLECQKSTNETFYLQPKTSDAIKIIEDPSNLPITLYVTTSNDVNTVSYQCEIMKWENKQELDGTYLDGVTDKLAIIQPSETTGAYLSFDGIAPSRHLIHVKNMVKTSPKFPITDLILTSSDEPCKERSQGGGHAVVYLPTEIIDSSVTDVVELSNGIIDTSTVALVNARLGQGRFRKNVINTWGNKEMCALTGIDTKELLIASHIKPWSESNSEERLDGANGILLASHIDKLFDAYLITFRKKGSDYVLVPAKRLSKMTMKELNLDKGMTLLSGYLMNHEQNVDKYLVHHNSNFDELDN